MGKDDSLKGKTMRSQSWKRNVKRIKLRKGPYIWGPIYRAPMYRAPIYTCLYIQGSIYIGFYM